MESWILRDSKDQTLGRMSRAFAPPEGLAFLRGEIGAIVAQMDEIERKRRKWERECWRMEKEELEAFDASVAKVCQMADVIAKAAMVAAGFHRHRGEWRRRRVQKEQE